MVNITQDKIYGFWLNAEMDGETTQGGGQDRGQGSGQAADEDKPIDSAATSTEEIGNPIDPPMRAAIKQKGISVESHHARQLTRADYDRYDLIYGA